MRNSVPSMRAGAFPGLIDLRWKNRVAAVEHARHHIQNGFHPVRVGGHAGDALLHELEVCERPAKLITRLNPFDALVHGCPGAAGHAC